jgi:hypothetical protein
MVATLVSAHKRLQRLEGGGRGPGGGGCGYCGDGDDDRRDEPYIITFDDETPPDFPETCPECGRELITTIYFDDDPRAPWNQGTA